MHMTERRREATWLLSCGWADSPLLRLVIDRAATMPRGDLLSQARGSPLSPAKGLPSLQVLDELREERL